MHREELAKQYTLYVRAQLEPRCKIGTQDQRLIG